MLQNSFGNLASSSTCSRLTDNTYAQTFLHTRAHDLKYRSSCPASNPLASNFISKRIALHIQAYAIRDASRLVERANWPTSRRGRSTASLCGCQRTNCSKLSKSSSCLALGHTPIFRTERGLTPHQHVAVAREGLELLCLAVMTHWWQSSAGFLCQASIFLCQASIVLGMIGYRRRWWH